MTTDPADRSRSSIKEDWDFYLARVDDAPASIRVDLGLRASAPFADAPVLYHWTVFMRDPGDHGMGTELEGDEVFPAEDAIVDRGRALGLCYVGRLRNRGYWQYAWYGAEGLEREFAEAAADAARHLGSWRDHETGSLPDPDWEHYTAFLYPDVERHQWILDRRVVEALQREGDDTTRPRPVDHHLYLPNADARAAVERSLADLGFATLSTADDGPPERPFVLDVVRDDAPELEGIHALVMELRAVAEQHGGEYDGWGCASAR